MYASQIPLVHTLDWQKYNFFWKRRRWKFNLTMKLLPCISITYIHTAEAYVWSSSQFHFIRNKLNGTITILHTAQQQNQRYSYDNAMKIWIKFYLAIIVRVCAYQHSNHTYKKISAMKNYQITPLLVPAADMLRFYEKAKSENFDR